MSCRKVQKWGQIVRREKKPDGLENSREWFYMPTLHCLTWGKEYIKHKVPHRLEVQWAGAGGVLKTLWRTRAHTQGRNIGMGEPPASMILVLICGVLPLCCRTK